MIIHESFHGINREAGKNRSPPTRSDRLTSSCYHDFIPLSIMILHYTSIKRQVLQTFIQIGAPAFIR